MKNESTIGNVITFGQDKALPRFLLTANIKFCQVINKQIKQKQTTKNKTLSRQLQRDHVRIKKE